MFNSGCPASSLRGGLSLVADSGGDSLVGVQRLPVAAASPVAELRFWGAEAAAAAGCGPHGRGSRLWNTGLMAVVQGLRCSVAHGISPDQGSNPGLLLWQADSLPLSHQGSPHFLNRKNIYICVSLWF